MGKIRRRKDPSIKATGGKNQVFNPATSLFVQMSQRYGESERYTIGESGAPMIDNTPVVMECQVEDVYETQGFDNFVCTIREHLCREKPPQPAGQAGLSHPEARSL